MTEQEYINVKDLAHITDAIETLSCVVIGNQPNIPNADYNITMQQLRKWQIRLFSVSGESIYD